MLDIIPSDTLFNASSLFLNKSFEFYAQNILDSPSKNLNEDLLQKINLISKRNGFKDNPLNWLGLSFLKNSRLNENSSKQLFDHDFLDQLVASEPGKSGIDFYKKEVNGFVYEIPLNISEKLNHTFEGWTTFQNLKEYEQWDKLFSKSLDLIKSIDNDILPEINKLIKYILVLYSNDSAHGSMSPQNLTGTVLLPDTKDHTLIAECLVHEALHQYLYRLEHLSPLFVGDNGLKEIYYSPWKEEPRPLIMVLHGAFVFAGVVLFYYELLKKKIVPEFTDEIEFRIANRITQIEIALEVLSEKNHLTEFGNSLLNILIDYMKEVKTNVTINESLIENQIYHHKKLYSTLDYLHVSTQKY